MRTSRRSTPQDGFVQTKTLEDGSTVTALVVAPKMPGRPAPSILHLKGTDFLSDLRARGTDPGTTNFIPYSFRVPALIHNLRTENVFQIDGRPFSGTAQLIRDSHAPDVFTSDDWVVFDCNLPAGGEPLEVRFTNGTITAKVNIEVSGNFIRYSVNDGPFQAATELSNSGPPAWPVRVVLPIDNNALFESVSDSDLNDYFGTWTVESTPVLFDPNFRDSQDNPLQATPFQFDLNGIVIEDITYQKKPNFIDSQGNEFYGGATFTAKARIVGPDGDLNNIKPNFAYSAKVRSLDGSLGFDGVVHELKGWTTGVTRQGTSLSFEWDGVGPGSVRYPPELDFGCSIWGVSTSSSAEDVATNQNATGEPATGKAHTGPPGYFPENPFDLQVSPNPFIPSEEEYIDADGDGELDWNDYDNDGIPDGWPPEADTDGDGLPDVPPPDPFVTITASPVKTGYTTESWTIHVRDESGDIIPGATFTGTNETPNVEWTPPVDLDSQQLQASIHVGLCRNATLPMTVRAQTAAEPLCLTSGETTRFAYDPGVSLMVLKANGSTFLEGDIYGLSTDSGFNPSTGAQLRLGTVRDEQTFDIVLNDPTGSAELPDEVLVEVSSEISGFSKSVTLRKSDSYTLSLSEADLVKPVNVFAAPGESQLEAKTAYAALSIDSRAEFTTVVKEEMDKLAVDTPYPRDRVSFGRFSNLRSTGSTTIGKDEALYSGENLKKLGFEQVEFRIANGPDTILGLTARVKVRNTPTFLKTTTFGLNNSSLDIDIGNGGDAFGPNDIQEAPKTWIIEGCNVLDYYDVNNNRGAASRAQGDRIRPGLDWWRQTRSRNTALLGYNFPIGAGGVNEVFRNYMKQLPVVASQLPSGSQGRVQQLAWLKANFTFKNDIAKRGRLAACAFDNDRYYYIAYYPPYPGDIEARFNESGQTIRARTVFGIFSVPLGANGELEKPAWTTEDGVPQTSGARLEMAL